MYTLSKNLEKKIVSKKFSNDTPINYSFLMIIFLPNKQEKRFLVKMSMIKHGLQQTISKTCFQRKKFFCNFKNNEKNQTVFNWNSLMASIQEEFKRYINRI